MFSQYGSVLCISCESSMRLATIEPGEAGTSTATFESRYPPCARSRVMVIGAQQDAPSGGFGLFLRDGMEARRAETGFPLAGSAGLGARQPDRRSRTRPMTNAAIKIQLRRHPRSHSQPINRSWQS
jgi:hypothetical protein